MSHPPAIKHVDYLPDLIEEADYESVHRKRLVRIRISVGESGVEILGDSAYPQELERLLTSLCPECIEAMLCG